MTEPEVITLGRVGVDLYPEQIGVTLAEARTFRKSLGGTAANVAVAAARLGRRSALVSKVGDDPFGVYVRQALAGFGVDPRWVGTDPVLRTPIVFCEVHPPDHFPILFYRAPKAPDLEVAPEDLDLEAIAATPLFWTTGSALSEEPSRSAVMRALEQRSARAAGEVTVLDLDYRPGFWASADDARREARRAIAHATVAVGNRDEVEMAVETRDPWDASTALLDLGVRLAVVKRGPDGVLARTRDTTVEEAAIPVDVLNGLGAGDAFGGALCHGLLAGWPLAETVAFANAAGAIVATRLMCADDMPSADEVNDLLARSAAERAR